MKIYIMAAAFLLFAANSFASCSKEEDTTGLSRPATGENGDNGGGDTATGSQNDSTETTTGNIMDIKIGDRTFTATLAGNTTAEAFKARLPLTLTMSELNGNEKYRYLAESLPTNPTRPGTIRAGDIMLYGSSCVVLFYETFSSSYSYSRIGSIDDPQGLAAALGRGSATVTFEISEKNNAL